MDGQRLALTYLDMNEIGLDSQQEDDNINYDMKGEIFYSDQIANSTTINSSNVKMCADVKKEVMEFDKLLSDCEAFLNRKTEII